MRRRYVFLSDAHLGCRATADNREREQRLVRFLSEVSAEAEHIYLLGDVFDFWFEYPNCVPSGHTRLLGKLSELTDAGIEVHLVAGNHDLWASTYLATECGITIHHKPLTVRLGSLLCHMAHGDGLGDPDRKFALLRRIFRNRFCQRLFRLLHPSLGLELGLRWASHSRKVHSLQGPGGDPPYKGEANEHLVCYAKTHHAQHTDVDCYLFGHRHIELDLMLTRRTRLMILGDWVSQYTYAASDGQQIMMDNYTD